jgi:tryptophanyl-tRNA synthetase
VIQKPLRSLTGVKPTGAPHVGNYLGAIRPALELTQEYESFLFIADLHALTTERDKKQLEEQTYAVAATWLAFGLDPKKVVFYKQSDVLETTTLAWILSCMAPMGFLYRAHSFKEAKDKGQEEMINHGVFFYPVLMAADILLYEADVVPVGQDQKQHLEIAQELARKFNNAYGEVLRVPAARIDPAVMTIRGLDGRKMSKSYNNTIEPFASDKEIKKKLDTIKTDSTPYGSALPMDSVVRELHQLLASPERAAAFQRSYESGRKDPSRPDGEFADPKVNYFGWGDAKAALREELLRSFGPARDEYTRLVADKAHLRSLLAEGAERARAVARPVLQRVMDACGYVR